MNGYPVILADTAGIRETEDVIEKEGVVRALKKAKEADFRIVVHDASEKENIEAKLFEGADVEKTLVIYSKADKLNQKVNINSVDVNGKVYQCIILDLTAEESGQIVADALAEKIEILFAQRNNAAMLTRKRHREAVQNAMAHLQQAVAIANTNDYYSVSELMAQDLRDAAAAIGRITGKADTEALLDVVFSSFCIGK